MSNKPRTSLTYQEKSLIIDEIKDGIITRKEAEAIYNVGKSTISGWFKNKKKIKDNQENATYRARNGLYPDYEDQLLEWYQKASQSYHLTHIPITETLMLHKLNEISGMEFGISYIQRLMRRKNLVCINLRGEASSCPTYNIEQIHNDMDILDPKYIFNMDEFGLYYKEYPSKMIVQSIMKRDFRGTKVIKNRITVVATICMDNSTIVDLFFIGKSQRPRCFKSNIPKNYTNQSSGWMNEEVFYKYLDTIFLPAVQKLNHEVILVLDNCRSHPRNLPSKYSMIKLQYLPPNTTSTLQPLDQGVISSLKRNYRKLILEKAVDAIEKFENVETEKYCGLDNGGDITVENCIKYMESCFKSLKTSTVVNCWLHSNLPSDRQKQILNLLTEHVDNNIPVPNNVNMSRITNLNSKKNSRKRLTSTSFLTNCTNEEVEMFLNLDENEAFMAASIDDIIDEEEEDDEEDDIITTIKRKIEDLEKDIDKVKRQKNKIAIKEEISALLSNINF